jgi:predicted nuclease of predicted toxin-antitoxin system
VKLLIDENLPPRLAGLLNDAGHDAVHVRDLGAAEASDPQVIDLALAEGRIIVSADTDFGPFLASAGATEPSVVLVREVVDRQPPELAALLASCTEQLETRLSAGAMVALTSTGARVRRLTLLERMSQYSTEGLVAWLRGVLVVEVIGFEPTAPSLRTMPVSFEEV